MSRNPVIDSRRSWRRAICGCLAVCALSLALPTARAEEDPEAEMAQLLERIEELSSQPENTETELNELGRLIDRYEQLLRRQEQEGQKPEATPKPDRKPERDSKTEPPRKSARKSRRPGRPPRQPSPTPSSTPAPQRSKPREATPKVTPSENGVRPKVELDIDVEDLLKPFWERKYSFSIKDGTYADLVESFRRMSGLPVMGDAPSGTVSFVSGEVMDFKTALGRVQMLLFKHADKYWLLPYPADAEPTEYKYLEIVRVTEGTRFLPLRLIFPKLQEYLNAGLADNDLALLLYTPESGSIADLEPIRDFMPDYVRIAPYHDKNAMTVFGLVSDVNKYLALIDKFKVTEEDPRKLVVIPVEHVSPSGVVETLETLMGGFDPGPGGPAKSRKPGQPSIAAAQARNVVIIPNDEMKQLLVKAMPVKIEEIRELLRYIDVPVPEPDQTPVVVRVENTSVQAVMAVVQPIIAATVALYILFW